MAHSRIRGDLPGETVPPMYVEHRGAHVAEPHAAARADRVVGPPFAKQVRHRKERDAKGLPTTVALLHVDIQIARPGRGVQIVDHERPRRHVEFTEDDTVLPGTLARLSSAGIAVTEFSLHLPSLDEVFFTLTGSRTDADLDTDTEGSA